jgi:hypothetical protein
MLTDNARAILQKKEGTFGDAPLAVMLLYKPKRKECKMKNLCGKTRPKDNPYETWKSFDGSWTWQVLKKYQSPEKEAQNPYARWFCNVVTPIVPEGEMGDVYVRDITNHATKVEG